MSNTRKRVKAITDELIVDMIHEIRGRKVMLDYELAELYGYETKRFNEQIKRNIEKFPDDFMFQLTDNEVNFILRSQIATANYLSTKSRYNPYAFTEQGVYMLMTVLKGEIATKQSIALVRAFKQMKDYISSENGGLPYQIYKRVEEQNESIKELQTTVDEHTKQLEMVMNNFADPNTMKHFLLFKGQKIEAVEIYQNIFKQAKHSIIIIDDYIDISTLKMLKVCLKTIDINIYSDNCSKNGIDETTLNTFVKETGITLSIFPTNKEVHDRYIVIDYGFVSEKGYHSGSSLKDSGNAITSIDEFEDKKMYLPILQKILLNKKVNI